MMVVPNALVIVFVVMFYVALPVALILFLRKTKSYYAVLWVVYFLFLLVLLVGVLGKIEIGKTYSNITFDFSGEWANKKIGTSFDTTKTDFLINIAMLVPVGQLVCLISKIKRSRFGVLFAVVAGGFCGVLIETMQFVLPVMRSVQFSDVVYNTVSAVIGYLFASFVYYAAMWIKSFKNNRKHEQD